MPKKFTNTLLICLVCVTLACVHASVDHERSVDSDADSEAMDFSASPAINHEIIYQVNTLDDTTWEAGINDRFRNRTLLHVKGLCGVLRGNGPHLPRLSRLLRLRAKSVVLPDSYDVRSQWASTCPSVNEIRDQSNCGSCWAIAAAEAMTDRLCIQSNGSTQVHLSAADIVSCCGFSCGLGCQGGYPAGAWSYFKTSGVVSGGNYDATASARGCLPYPFPPCEHHMSGARPDCGSDIATTPRCTRRCQNDAVWAKDKQHGKSLYSLQGEREMMTDLFEHGPLEGQFTVYEDFVQYRSGVYSHVTGTELGGHAIKIIGWGATDRGTKYWTVANSWNTDWGESGSFRIRRGVNECGIESEANAGLPLEDD